MQILNFPNPVKGVDHLSNETSLKEGTVRIAENITLDKVGNFERREGYMLRISDSGFHSLYSTSRGWLLACQKNVINILDPETYALTPIASMNDSSLTSFTEYNDNIYYSNIGSSGMFRVNNIIPKDIGVHLPAAQPQFSAGVNGALLPGTYGITYTLVDTFGEESGTGSVSFVDLPNGGGIVGTMFPLVAGYTWRIYLTTADGEEFYQAAEFAADTIIYTVMTHTQGRQPETYQLKPLPFGYTIRGYGARLFVAGKDAIYHSCAFRPHLHNPATDFIPIVGFPYMMEPVDTGMFFSDVEGVKFLRGGDATDFQVTSVSAEHAIFGTSAVIPGSFMEERFKVFDRVVVWLSQSGYQVGLPTGEVIPLHNEQVRLPNYVQGCSTYFTFEGKKQMVTPVLSNEFDSLNKAIDSSIM